MLYFGSDYMEGAHPLILDKLNEINLTKNTGYGLDGYCEKAAQKIKNACGLSTGEVYFLVGGTQANLVVISSLLRPYEGVISAKSGHISVHEGGAIENSGHKIITFDNPEGKVLASDVKQYMVDFYKDETHPHMVQPGMIYISHPTEYGTLYTKDEISDLRAVSNEYGLKLYMDGARMGYGLAADTDVDLPFIASNVDAFYIGGTKVGALFGEAVVFPDPSIVPKFFTSIKLNGALLAKGWLLGVQFDTLFTDNLYLNISKHAIEQAMRIKTALSSKGYKFFIDSPTNQQFIIIKNTDLENLNGRVSYSFWEKYDDEHTVIRLVTSWATSPSDVDKLIEIL